MSSRWLRYSVRKSNNTKRHLNEYTSMDFEMGYIDGYEDIMQMETGFLQYTMELLKTEYAKELEMLQVELPDVSRIPSVPFAKAKELVAEKYNRQIRNPHDLEPEEEQLIGRYFKEEYGADFVFVTEYPSKKRPFYAMDDPKDPSSDVKLRPAVPWDGDHDRWSAYPRISHAS